MNPTSQTTPPEFKEPCFHVPGSRTIIDTAELDSDGVYRSTIKKETLAQVRIRYPDAEIGEWENIYRAAENSCKTEPQEITEAQYIYALEVLPPVCWKNAKGVESFKMSERFYGNVTAIYARLGKRYFTYYDGGPQPESEADIIELCAEDNTIIFCEAGHIIDLVRLERN